MTAHRPIGKQNPSAEMLLVGGVLHATIDQARAALKAAHASDVADPWLRRLLEAAGTLATAGVVGPALVADQLLADGALAGDRGKLLAKKLTDAATSGADPLMLRQYATAVVAQSYRRRITALAEGLTAADEMPERDLWPYVRDHTQAIGEHWKRLACLRGDAE
ncbi:hypothetical protein FOS14_19985 [Skermania sp. ID1734]|uniref:hypothetical protein n=1 Tax=Skermania sp. ID1734 TaxID=2597516 RepID=UPI00117D3D01|nr:hypothetical protein [Skermania sp. ID1734]TSD94595.1 hypothetical protein FOS14_19985 [Skermania sp. ID1734]